MHQSLRPFSLVPSGFVVVSAVHDVTNTAITVRASSEFCGMSILRYRFAARAQSIPSPSRRSAAVGKER